MVIGAQKCGTSALHYYLDLHPEVSMSTPKELSFFLDQGDFEPGPYVADDEKSLVTGTRNWSRGVDWYAGHFDGGARIRGESTPGYTSPWFPGVARRMAETVPDARLAYIVRDPVERAVSHYIHNRESGREWRSLEDALARTDNVYVGRSSYATALRPFLERYPRDRVLVLRQEDLLHDRRETMRRVFAWAGVKDFWDARMERERQPSGRKGRRHRLLDRVRRSRASAPFYRLPQDVKWVVERISYAKGSAERPDLAPELRERVIERLEPEVAEFEQLTGLSFPDWRRAGPAPPRERTRPR